MDGSHFPVDGHLGGFHRADMNKVAMNDHVQVLLWTYTFTSLG